MPESENCPAEMIMWSFLFLFSSCAVGCLNADNKRASEAEKNGLVPPLPQTPTKEQIASSLEVDSEALTQDKKRYESTTWSDEKERQFLWVVDKFLGCVLHQDKFAKNFKDVHDDQIGALFTVANRTDIAYVFYCVLFNYNRVLEFMEAMKAVDANQENSLSRKAVADKIFLKKRKGDAEKRDKLYQSTRKMVIKLEQTQQQRINASYKELRRQINEQANEARSAEQTRRAAEAQGLTEDIKEDCPEDFVDDIDISFFGSRYAEI